MLEENYKNLSNPLTTQVGGDHYKGCGIQPVEYIHANNLDYLEGNVIKYMHRWRYKNGQNSKQDLEKARWYLNKLINLI